MITAVDSNVIIDVVGVDRTFSEASANILRRCIAEGAIVACDVVWAEVAAVYEHRRDFAAAMQTLGLMYSPVADLAAQTAGAFWRAYRARGGSRQRVTSDFLIGAHALHQCDRLLTRDRGFYRNHFEKLRLVE